MPLGSRDRQAAAGRPPALLLVPRLSAPRISRRKFNHDWEEAKLSVILAVACSDQFFVFSESNGGDLTRNDCRRMMS